MNRHKKWSIAVQVELLRRQKKIKDMAKELGYSAEWCRATIYGRNVSPSLVNQISEYLGVENYLEG